MHFQTNLKFLRAHKRRKGDEVASAIGVSRTVMSGWENQGYEPRYAQLVALSDYYRVRIDDLLRTDLTKLPVYKLEEMQRGFNS